LNEQLKLLQSLQEIDSAVLSLTGEIELLPKKLEKFSARLKEAKTSFEKIKAHYDKNEKEKKQKEEGLEDLEEKINRLKAKGAEIKTNKEYEAHLREVQSIDESKNRIEEDILNAMESLDTLVNSLRTGEETVKKAEDDFR
jgi:predicted  nucleic acid-binding Zn-ribbon protein